MAINDTPESGKIGLLTVTLSQYDELHFDDIAFSMPAEGFAVPTSPVVHEMRRLGDLKQLLKIPGEK